MGPESQPIPSEILYLIRAGVWPADRTSAQLQNLAPLVDAERVRQLAPDEDCLYLYPPPFHTLAWELESPLNGLSAEELALSSIEASEVVVIGDFGAGSDTAIALDHTSSRERPKVLRLQWRLPEHENRWIEMAPSLHQFCRALGFELPPDPPFEPGR